MIAPVTPEPEPQREPLDSVHFEYIGELPPPDVPWPIPGWFLVLWLAAIVTVVWWAARDAQ